MMIVVDGPSLSGRTAVALQVCRLAHDQGRSPVLLSAPTDMLPGQEEKTYEKPLCLWKSAIDSTDSVVICDGWHLGAYARRGARLTTDQFEHVEHYLDLLGALRVVVHADRDVLRARCIEQNRPLRDADQTFRIEHYFDQVAMEHHWHRVQSPLTPARCRDLLIWADVAYDRAHVTPRPSQPSSSISTPLTR